MWGTIFNPENGFFQTIDRIFTVVAMSFLWVVLCIPLVTAGPATAALYYTMVKCWRRREPFPYKNFVESFRLNLKTGLLASLVCLVAAQVVAMLLYMFYQMAASGDRTAMVLLVAGALLALVLLGYLAYLFPTLSRFDVRLGGLFSLSARLAVAHAPTTLALGVLLLVVGSVIRFWPFGLFVLPALTAIWASLLLERVLKSEMLRTMELPPEDERPWYLR
ncbi:YesL family protein [Flavonifractor sp. An92]|uniref:YesL family protein n=1 Tax=Flavonifractor sp. An92 TaxID=1965666 RepID=UPI001302BB30|nr:YesL family protein [Flavonifractor sp. An92]